MESDTKTNQDAGAEANLPELERMAKLRLSETERAEAKRILRFLTTDFERLARVDTTDVVPLVHGIELTNRLREDRAHKTISREKLLENAPEQNNGYFQVPKTLE